jgi:hypothetical protein
LVALIRGLTRDESAEALRYRAAVMGLSIHAAALAVLTPEPIDELLITRSTRPAQSPSRGRLYALEPLGAPGAAATTRRAASTPPPRRNERGHGAAPDITHGLD